MNTPRHRPYFTKIAASLGLLFVGYLSSLFLHSQPTIFKLENQKRSNKHSISPLINPLFECADTYFTSNKQITDLKQTLSKLIESKKQNGVDLVSVYFRDLNNGPWFGINEDITFIPGSLLKVPLMIGIYNLATDNPSLLNEKIIFGGTDATYPQFFPSSEPLKINETYSVDDLINSMIRNSDNEAALLLTQIFKDKDLTDIYSELGIEEPTSGEYTIPVYTYASFFRILYNATFLDKQFSVKALKLLTESKFAGIGTPLPKDIVVAHKFGERYNNDQRQLHDCGIVYATKRPYLLCIMTRGNDFTKLQKTIQEISSAVYQSIALSK